MCFHCQHIELGVESSLFLLIYTTIVIFLLVFLKGANAVLYDAYYIFAEYLLFSKVLLFSGFCYYCSFFADCVVLIGRML